MVFVYLEYCFPLFQMKITLKNVSPLSNQEDTSMHLVLNFHKREYLSY